MITSTTPHKLAEIIMDTWPNLYRPSKNYKPPSNYRLLKNESDSETSAD
jgi:hypothetical protein